MRDLIEVVGQLAVATGGICAPGGAAPARREMTVVARAVSAAAAVWRRAANASPGRISR
jgi:hypothetical protein